MSTHSHQRLRAFTLIELLACIAIIAVLSGIILATLGSSRRSAERATSNSNLRTIGLGIVGYAADHRGTLPGPLWNTQAATYQSINTQTLGYLLWTYLGDPEPRGAVQESKIIANPAHKRQRENADTPVYAVQKTIRMPGDAAGIRPFGYRDSAGTINDAPININLLSRYDTAKTWALQDVDQLSSEVTNYTVQAKSALLPAPALGNVRMTLYFDWHIQAVPAN